MIVQGCWAEELQHSAGPNDDFSNNDYFQNIPHMDAERSAQLYNSGVESLGKLIPHTNTLEDFMGMAGIDFTKNELKDMKRALGKVPDIDVKFYLCPLNEMGETVEGALEEAGEAQLTVQIEKKNWRASRNVEIMRYPKSKECGFLIIVGCPQTGELLALKRSPVGNRKMKATFTIPLPDTFKDKHLVVYVLSDTYMGIDQRIPINLRKANEVLKGIKAETDARSEIDAKIFENHFARIEDIKSDELVTASEEISSDSENDFEETEKTGHRQGGLRRAKKSTSESDTDDYESDISDDLIESGNFY